MKKICLFLAVMAFVGHAFGQDRYPMIAPFLEFSPTVVPFKNLEIVQQNTLTTAAYNNAFSVTTLTNSLQVGYGLSRKNRLSLVGTVAYDHARRNTERESVMAIFSNAGNPYQLQRGFTSFGAHLRFVPLRKLPNLTVQAGVTVPISRPIYSYSLAAIGQLRVNYQHQFKPNFSLFATVGSDISFPKRALYSREVGLSVGLHPVYQLPNKRTTLNGTLQLNINDRFWNRCMTYGVGVSHYISPQWNVFFNAQYLSSQPVYVRQKLIPRATVGVYFRL